MHQGLMVIQRYQPPLLSDPFTEGGIVKRRLWADGNVTVLLMNPPFRTEYGAIEDILSTIRVTLTTKTSIPR
jgi:hypothetical protein